MKVVYQQDNSANPAIQVTVVDFNAATFPVIREINIASDVYVLPIPLKPNLGETVTQFTARLQTELNARLINYWDASSNGNVSTSICTSSTSGPDYIFKFGNFTAYNKVAATSSISATTNNYPVPAVNVVYDRNAFDLGRTTGFYTVEITDESNANTTVVGAVPSYTTSVETRQTN